MFFTIITFITAFLIEGLGTVVSVIGLSSLFGANPIIIALAVALDLGKIVVVTLLYKYWKELSVLMKSYALVAATVTMVITSAGAAGYLSGEFQRAISGVQEGTLKVEVLKEEQTKLEARKKQIDDQVANLPADRSRARINLMKEFETEQKRISERLVKIQEELPQLQLAQIGTEAKAGPILYIAKAFDISVEEAVKWVILMIIFVFDPLAIFLIIAGNFLLEKHRLSKTQQAAKQDSQETTGALAVTTSPLTDEQFEDRAEAVEEAQEHYKHVDLSHAAVHTNAPDASRARVYTRQDLIDAGVSDKQLIYAGYEPREKVETEVLLPEPPTQDEGPVARTFEAYDESQVRPPVEREEPVQISLSSLGAVIADPNTKIADTGEIGYRTGAYRSGTQPR